MDSWEIRRVPITHPDALRLVEEVQEEYVVRYGGRDDTPLDPTAFEPPAGAFYVAYLGDEPVVTGAWRRRTDVEVFDTTATVEIKRMYVVASRRGQGLARTMLAHLERTAREAGAQAMILETGMAQPEAIALYASAGYTAIPGFGHYSWSPDNRCFARLLDYSRTRSSTPTDE